MMAKAVLAEATGRQVASFVLGSVATLTVVLLLQHRPEELRRPMSVQFSGWSGRNGMASAEAGAPPVVIGGGETAGDRDNVTKQPADAAAADIRLPSGAKDRQEEEMGTEEEEDQQEAAAAEEEFRGLAAVVERAASPEERTVIITCVNQAWAAPGSLLDLFLESFRIGDGIAHLLDHVLIVAMDRPAMARCRTLHRHCYLYTAAPGGMNFTSAKYFLSEEYLELVWSKLKLQRRVLQLGYDFLFTDVDVMWFRDPFKHVTVYADMTVSSDVFFGDPDNIDNFPNTGFFHVRQNNRTLAMTRAWHQARSRFPGKNEQPVFNAIKKDLVRDLGLRVRYLDPAFMGGFCSYGKDLSRICTMHANCCVGLRAKLRDLTSVLRDWKRYTAMPHWARHAANWTVPGACIH